MCNFSTDQSTEPTEKDDISSGDPSTNEYVPSKSSRETDSPVQSQGSGETDTTDKIALTDLFNLYPDTESAEGKSGDNVSKGTESEISAPLDINRLVCN